MIRRTLRTIPRIRLERGRWAPFRTGSRRFGGNSRNPLALSILGTSIAFAAVQFQDHPQCAIEDSSGIDFPDSLKNLTFLGAGVRIKYVFVKVAVR